MNTGRSGSRRTRPTHLRIHLRSHWIAEIRWTRRVEPARLAVTNLTRAEHFDRYPARLALRTREPHERYRHGSLARDARFTRDAERGLRADRLEEVEDVDRQARFARHRIGARAQVVLDGRDRR